MNFNLLALDGNAKIDKSQCDSPYLCASLSLAPHTLAGGATVCPQSSPACRAACVGGPSVGLASIWPTIMQARVRKTQMLRQDRAGFLALLKMELRRAQEIAESSGRQLVVRLNTFSDLAWESSAFGEIPQQFQGVTFYDYTKRAERVTSAPENYHLTFSLSELPSSEAKAAALLRAGHSVAVVFGDTRSSYTGPRAIMQDLPKRWTIGGETWSVYDGDATDFRFLDVVRTKSGRGRICGLRLKAASAAAHTAGLESGFALRFERD
jgi:hypothetical protein